MRRLNLITTCLLTTLIFWSTQAELQPPNIVLIFADDVGYGDLGCYGAGFKTPALDKLATEGIRATDFISAANVCSPSRAALLTGRYPMRCGLPAYRTQDKKHEYFLHSDEITFAEQLKKANYNTYALGKWHIGFRKQGVHPIDQGFDTYYGLAHNYSTRHDLWNQSIYRDRKIIEKNIKFPVVTAKYNKELQKIIHAQTSDQPFMIYMAHQIAHSPIAPNDAFKGKSGKGKYADFMTELDDSCRIVLAALEEKGFTENTLVIFTSDNGHVPRTGSGGPLSGGKYVTMEGGHRVPFIAKWPEKLPAGTTIDTTISSMDLYATFCNLAGVDLPNDRKIDGKNILPILKGESKEAPHEYLYYYNGKNLQAIRRGQWKLHLPRTKADQPYWGKAIREIKGTNPGWYALEEHFLVNLEEDIGELNNIASQHPEVVTQLLAQADRIRKELGDSTVQGTDQRPQWPLPGNSNKTN